jgi:hypothetical protein
MKRPAYSVIINIELLIKVKEFCIIISTFGFCSLWLGKISMDSGHFEVHLRITFPEYSDIRSK